MAVCKSLALNRCVVRRVGARAGVEDVGKYLSGRERGCGVLRRSRKTFHFCV